MPSLNVDRLRFHSVTPPEVRRIPGKQAVAPSSWIRRLKMGLMFAGFPGSLL